MSDFVDISEFLILDPTPNENGAAGHRGGATGTVNSSQVPSTEQSEASWTHNATLVLLDLYQKYRNKVGTLAIPNLKKMWQIIANGIAQLLNMTFTPAQVKNRWRVVERNYKKYIDNNNKTGRGRKHFDYAKEMEQILGKKTNIRPELVLSQNTVSSLVTLVGPEEKDSGNIDKASDKALNNTSILDTPTINASISVVNTPKATDINTPSTSTDKGVKSIVSTPKHSLNKENEGCSIKSNILTKKHRPATRNNILELIRQDRRDYYKDCLKLKREKLELQKQAQTKLEARNELIRERNEILKEYLNRDLSLPEQFMS
ncbi:hypothetical protein NQ315_012314 [Exocentrus adspersus]|uniref:Myb-like domain-containing protein n=1 Tax=Exocentrus adspersus TaxID=1586481 RepID=A0AAV8VD24_9CUCU|nr:hypothetical protein NQ315_012314 [Exocentrus adspersus]